MNKFSKSVEFGGRTITIETGVVARQATGSVMISCDDTVLLVTVVGKKESDPGRDFFPLTVNYQEKFYAAGRIPGGFFRREGRPGENETLTCRLIDRPLRPLFPEGFTNEVQIVATVMSSNPEVAADILAIIGSSAALAISGIPFHGPVAAARVGFADGNYILNPTPTELETSALDLVVAGTQDAVLMVESQAKELTEEQMLGAVMFGHREMQKVIDAINELKVEAGKEPWSWVAPQANTTLENQVANLVKNDLVKAYEIQEKQLRQEAIGSLKAKAVETLVTDAEDSPSDSEIASIFKHIEKDIVRGRIIAGEPRIDGRDTKTVRPIAVETTVLPRVHGSALFTRGETQAIVAATLGTERDAQILDGINGETKDPFMLHYNFPPYSVGECGMMGSPKRREIGHGWLARRAITAVLPNMAEYPYTIRIVSEITESNGSSSMATVCGTSLALMDAGVAIKAPVAGIAMGLVKEGNNFAVLTDILGDEDHLGDMDFKVAGTENGVTALQMDIKIDGITEEIMQVALAQAHEGRKHILGIMNQNISTARSEMSQHAPRIITIKIHPDKIRDVIGKGGCVIREIIEKTGATVDIDDDGLVKIASVDASGGDAAKQWIENITADPEVGKVYVDSTVKKIMEFGAFVEFMPGREGLVHISQIKEERVNDVNDHLTEGQKVTVKLLEIDKQGRMRLSMKDVNNAESAE
jgi:polyribonucleotide nucleotidyltransferase